MEYRVVATDIEFAEGPLELPGGDILYTEIRAGTLTRVSPDGSRKETFATTGGGPNGAAIGPDGAIYVTQNGGFQWSESRTSSGQRMISPGPRPEERLHRRPDPARQRRWLRGHDRLPRVRRRAPEGPQRPRLRPRGQLLLHRPRQTLRPPARHHRRLLRLPEGRLHPRDHLPPRSPERHRPQPRRAHALCRRDPHRPSLGLRHHRAGRDRRPPRGRHRPRRVAPQLRHV